MNGLRQRGSQQAEDEYDEWLQTNTEAGGRTNPLPHTHDYCHAEWETAIERVTQYAMRFCRVKEETETKCLSD
ncbi:MAG: hypothetical protein MSG64_17535 [Pyrinomonadaceae bacterium MAG19_C2-C3]|nr:hypothetical protein [Pyrinomonadaceae bacterium MAG19_C2-C3]